jgi:DNA-binding MarR family transcriptional regulator
MCGSHFCSIQITEDVRKFAAEQGIDEASAIERGLHDKAKEFQQRGAEVYAKSWFKGVLAAIKQLDQNERWQYFPTSAYTHSMTEQLDMSAAENCVCFNLRWVTRAVTQFYDAEMRRHGIRPTQGSILASLQAKDSWNMAELSDWLGMERTTLVRNLRPLQRDGFVKTIGGGRGNRVEVMITTKGRKQIEKLTPAWKSAQNAVVKTLGKKRWSTILSDLETAALALNNNK